MEDLATTSDHPLETAARAVTAGLSTELVTVLATIAVSATYGGVIGAGRSLLLAHAVGAGLGVAVAWGAAERAQARWSLRAALLVGTLLAPLAPLGARYAIDVADTHDVILATQGVLEALRATRPSDLAWIAGAALLGYAPALVARSRGVGLVGQVVACTWGLAALAAIAAAGDAMSGSWPLRAWAALLLCRAAALPVGVALGDRLGARLVRALRGSDEPRAPTPAVEPRPALLLLPLGLATFVLPGRCVEEPLEVTLARVVNHADEERVELGRALISEESRELGVSGPRSWSALSATPLSASAWSFRAGAQGYAGMIGFQPLSGRSLVVTPPELLRLVNETAPVVGLHASGAECLRGPAARGHVAAMVALARVLESGTRFERLERRTSYYFERGRHVPSRAEHEEALRWWWRAAEAGDAGAQCALGQRLLKAREERAGLAWLRRSHEAGDLDAARVAAMHLQLVAPEEALRWGRLAASRGHADVVRVLLARHPHLREASDDALLGRRPELESTRGEIVQLPWDALLAAIPEPSGDAVADALARAAVSIAGVDLGAARALALAAVRRRPGQRTASLLLVAWHLRAAGGSGLRPDHVTVAEAFLEATAPPPRDALDPAVLTAGGLCDAARALLDPALDGGWAQRARERLASAERLAGFFDAAPARARVEALLARRGLREPWSTAGLIGALGRRHELAARRSQGSDTARAHLAAAERLRRLAGE